VFTGVRQAEGLGLTWADFELPKDGWGTMRVSAQLSRKKRGEPAKRVPIKSARRRKSGREREVEIPPELIELLREHRKEALARGLYRQDGFVFSTAEGKPLYYRNALRDLGTAADRAGLNDGDVPQLSTHDLRHTAISRWIAAGLDPAQVARMAGDRVDVILEVYAHEFEKAKRQGEMREALAAGTSITLRREVSA
jgi:integrase